MDGIDISTRATDINAMRRRIGMVFQSFNLYPHMTALGNVTLALRKVLGKPRAEAERSARAALERVGLADKARVLSRRASGGQQQRVAIARAIALEPEVDAVRRADQRARSRAGRQRAGRHARAARAA